MQALGEASSWLRANPAIFAGAVGEHLLLSFVGLALGIAVALPLGLAVAHRPRLAELAITLAGALRTLPSLAVLAALLPLLGVGFTPSVIALALLALPPVLVNLVVGLQGADPAAVAAAKGLGMTPGQVLRRVELPLALPLLFAGLRIAAVQVVSAAALATFIGGGGLGDLVTQGLALLDTGRMLLGAVAIAALALLTEAGFGLLERRLQRGVQA
ncbi:ABC transporter permease subunit [Siccirubricoccus sp. KC 17139]|uniref:ABC transporter permease subunit n=1 Tax=Siccirubricoccus soli TaxID=2899147 RepID=A0ABT1D788_9PROT|nr:ABC transporter permease subunit [Siccirubricoccus soli]MCO6417467.1 ABC transporter permease subunit [Siccirubricoccus soli]MCP2683602.1 ABC transporter permease subunit [Siccirubricoccus soli]